MKQHDTKPHCRQNEDVKILFAQTLSEKMPIEKGGPFCAFFIMMLVFCLGVLLFLLVGTRGRKGGRQAGRKDGSKQARKEANKHARKQANKEETKEGRKKEGREGKERKGKKRTGQERKEGKTEESTEGRMEGSEKLHV